MRSKIFFIILVFSFLLRVALSFFYGDQKIDHEWGVILDNFFQSGVFGFFKINGEVTPNLYMPPLYGFFLIALKYLVFDLEKYLFTIFFIQSLLSVTSSYFLFKLINKFYSHNVSVLMTIFYLFFPLNIYACTQVSSIIFQSSFFIIFLYYAVIFLKNEKIIYLTYASIFSGLLILLRGEFLAIFLIFLIFITYKKKFKFLLIYILVPLIIISPYLIRNYNIFDTLTITKSFGYNLWKGNNYLAKVEGNPGIFTEKIKKDLSKINDNLKHDLIRDNLFKSYAYNNLLNDPLKYIYLYFKKVISLIILDFESSYPNYYNFLHLVPKVLIFFTTILGIFFYDKKNKYLNLFLFLYVFYVLLFSLFFILPRYNLALLPLQILISASFIDFIISKKFYRKK